MGTGEMLMERYGRKMYTFPSQELPCSGSTGIISAFRKESTPRNVHTKIVKGLILTNCNFRAAEPLQIKYPAMKRILTIFFLLSLAFPALAQPVEKSLVYDENVDVRPLTGFTKIDVSGAVDLYLSQGTEDAVAVSAGSNEITSRIRTELRGNTLRIYFDAKGLNWKSWGNHKLKAYVTFKTMEGIEASGACNVRLTNVLKGKELEVEMSGASDLKGEIKTEFLRVRTSGASRITVSGSSTNLAVDANGASELRASDLLVDIGKVDVSGASVVRLHINKELNAIASGGSAVYYKGEGLIRDINTSGGATVKRRD